MPPDTGQPLQMYRPGSALAADQAPRITSLLVKPASAVCNLDCTYCFYLDRQADPYRDLRSRAMSHEVLDRLISGYLPYSFPHSVFVFQGGEPTLAGLDFYQQVVAVQEHHRRPGHTITNSLQTNGVVIDRAWSRFLAAHRFLVGLSLDGPEHIHDGQRRNRAGHGSWRAAMAALEAMTRERVEVNALTVVSRANVDRAVELYRFFRSIGIAHLQFIPLAEFDSDGHPLPFTIDARAYGRFLCDLFEVWWPDRSQVRIRFFDNVTEAVAGAVPGCCTLRQRCDSYAVVEYNGDVYPCDFFVTSDWRIGNILTDSWPDIARRPRRQDFSFTKRIPHAACARCEYRHICHGGCPKHRHGPRGRFDDLDWFCGAYKAFFSRAIDPIRKETRRLFEAPQRSDHSVG